MRKYPSLDSYIKHLVDKHILRLLVQWFFLDDSEIGKLKSFCFKKEKNHS